MVFYLDSFSEIAVRRSLSLELVVSSIVLVHKVTEEFVSVFNLPVDSLKLDI